jgi:hypothetical protein
MLTPSQRSGLCAPGRLRFQDSLRRVVLGGLLLAASAVEARDFRPARIPNGSVSDCNTCHSNGGGTARNAFGLAVEAAIGGTSANIPFWDFSLANQDSDGDGFTNGQELGDPNGLWPGQGPRAGATNPGDSGSFPRTPVFNSNPTTSATTGLAYSYQAVATEFNGLGVAYGKAAGPDWLSVSSTGLASGTPTASGSFTVTIMAFVDGVGFLSQTQTYTLQVAGGNNPPVFTSSPITTATVGQPYSYQATASDPDGHTFTFTNFGAPAWMTVSSSGLLSGTPPPGSAGSSQVQIRVRDNGVPQLSSFQIFTITVSESFATFAAWQSQNFNLPAEAALAAPGEDPDGDGLPNVGEYALKTPPRDATATRLMSNRVFNGSDRLEFSQVFRDDDPKLNVIWEVGGSLPLGVPEAIAPVITDPTPGDGLKTWTFTDTVTRTGAGARFGRLRFEILP